MRGQVYGNQDVVNNMVDELGEAVAFTEEAVLHSLAAWSQALGDEVDDCEAPAESIAKRRTLLRDFYSDLAALRLPPQP